MTAKATGGGGGYGYGAVVQLEREYGGGPIDIRQHFTGPEVRLFGATYVLPDFTSQVKRGAKLLDAHMPGWWKHIDTSALDLRDEDMCVLGQTWTHYAEGEQVVSQHVRRSRYSEFAARILGTPPGDKARDQGAKFGFNISNEQGKLINYQRNFFSTLPLWQATWEHLTRTWLAEIRRRQLKAERKALKKASQ